MHLGNLKKTAKLFENHFRVFADASVFIGEVQSLDGLVKDLAREKASLMGDIKRLESGRDKCRELLATDKAAHAGRVATLDSGYAAQNMKIKKALEVTAADVGRKIKGIDDRLIAAEADHEERIREMREEIETTEARVQTARSAAAQLKQDVERMGAT